MTMQSNFEKMSMADRITAAKKKTARVVDHLLYLLELHENNSIIVYSDILSSQIPTSFAANAFNIFQLGLHQFEIVRLCALWDRAESGKENIPTVIELIDDSAVIEALAREAASHWNTNYPRLINPSDDPTEQAFEREALPRSNEEFGRQQADKVRVNLPKTIDDARSIIASPILEVVMNLRDKHLAHSLSQTRREQRAGPVDPMKYGDEKKILEETFPIVEALYSYAAPSPRAVREGLANLGRFAPRE